MESHFFKYAALLFISIHPNLFFSNYFLSLDEKNDLQGILFGDLFIYQIKQ